VENIYAGGSNPKIRGLHRKAEDFRKEKQHKKGREKVGLESCTGKKRDKAKIVF